MIRVQRNRGPIGKTWQVVEGGYDTVRQRKGQSKSGFGKRWRTDAVLSEHFDLFKAKHEVEQHSVNWLHGK